MMDLIINDRFYRTGKLTPFQQFHVGRRLAPLLFAFGEAATNEKFMKLAATQDESVILALGPVVEAVSKMSDVDSEFVLNTCLGVCFRKQGEQYAPVKAGNGQLMFEDIDISEMMQLVSAVVRENLGNFIPGQPAK